MEYRKPPKKKYEYTVKKIQQKRLLSIRNFGAFWAYKPSPLTHTATVQHRGKTLKVSFSPDISPGWAGSKEYQIHKAISRLYKRTKKPRKRRKKR